METIIKVTPVLYKYKDGKYKYGIQVLNRKTNTAITIDSKTLKTLHSPYEWYETLESSKGNIIFDLTNKY